MKSHTNFARLAKFASACVAVLLTLSLEGATVTLKPMADTTLFESSADNNLGASRDLAAGTTANGKKSRALIKFDLTRAVPTNATISSATLAVTVVRTPGNGGVGSVFDLRRVLRDWAEGTHGASGGSGTAAAANETTWNARFFPATLWSQPGGALGVDFSTTVSASLAMAGTKTYSFKSTPALVVDVQAWVNDPAANFGWVLLSESENMIETARRFASRENATQAPTLVIDYALAAAPIQMAGMTLSNSVATISWTGGAPPFQLQQKTTMSDTNWLDIGAPLATNLAKINVSGSQSFFRVRQATP
ncbi:MAG: DNRLRE domain-containing protein [Verrucomicrobia bacterium]|nr:DNRLRE domain-containing protein [Verrucomicrobiota bacterium]